MANELGRGGREGEGRPKYLKMGEGPGVGVGAAAPVNDNAPAFTVTRGELWAIVAAAVERAMGAASALVVDRQGIARLLGCSPAHIDALRKQGLPTLMVGQAVRFEPAAVIGWLRERPKGASHATHG